MSSVNFLERLLDGVDVEWKVLGEVVHMRSGQHISASNIMEEASSEHPYPCFGGNGVRGFVAKNSHDGRYLLIGRQGALCGNVQRTNGKFYATEHAVVVTPSDCINIDWAFHLLTLMNLNQYASQSAQPGLTVGKIESLKIPIPCPENPKKSLEIQAEIVRILDSFIELTAELTAELSARKKQYNHYRDQLLSFKEGNVEWKALGEIGEFIRGKRFTKADYAEDGISVIHYGEIYTRYGVFTDQAFSQVRSDMAGSLRYAQPKDVIITDVGETVEDVGKAVAWLGDERVAIHDHCYAFRHSMNPKFVSYCMQTASFIAKKAKYVARTKINTLLITGFSKIAIPVPYPDDAEKSLAEQERIVATLEKFDVMTNSISEGLPGEIMLRQKQYEHYRDLLLSFPRPEEVAV
ncbi:MULTISPECIES: restriction endonuclease subunit S [Pseudomonas]|uniref:restriction endonuclease subunit S n=1 Tax=Pseudomonas TaxID=286 RepID=UPI001CE1704F|nr:MULTISPECIES: restriction endonuclease subunit S [Pseudomonas]MCA4964553.1 restriction endonuclease subunit S [Pseudomonas sp. Y24-6]MCE0883422.1 restriction endonuclease subunit S [Pseudomonas putida]MCE1083639.1 restriction endonuclease subunit S [Pseudomonas asiatica]